MVSSVKTTPMPVNTPEKMETDGTTWTTTGNEKSTEGKPEGNFNFMR